MIRRGSLIIYGRLVLFSKRVVIPVISGTRIFPLMQLISNLSMWYFIYESNYKSGKRSIWLKLTMQFESYIKTIYENRIACSSTWTLLWSNVFLHFRSFLTCRSWTWINNIQIGFSLVYSVKVPIYVIISATVDSYVVWTVLMGQCTNGTAGEPCNRMCPCRESFCARGRCPLTDTTTTALPGDFLEYKSYK